MQKFFVKENQLNKNTNEIEILGEDVNHIKNVLRCKIEEKILICIQEKESYTYVCSIKEFSKEKVICKIEDQVDEMAESNVWIHIVQALPKFDKMEYIIQKSTELGVKEITPLELKRCIVKLEEKEKQKKLQRWQKIAETASKQSMRDSIVKINEIYNLKNIFDFIKEYDIVLVAYENEKEYFLKDAISKLKTVKKENLKIAVIIGPEGGIENEEIEYMKQNGGKIISLGKRILRTETVSVSLASIIMYELGDLGSK